MKVWHGSAARRFSFLPAMALALLLAGCLLPGSEVTPVPPTAPPDPTPSGPSIVFEQPVGGGALYLIRYVGAGQDCLAASFDLRALEATHCGAFVGVGGGFVAALTGPTGETIRAACGWADAAVTAVAVEFADGGNAHTPVRNGGYLLVLEPGQVPRQGVGIDQYGNLVGRWAFAQ